MANRWILNFWPGLNKLRDQIIYGFYNKDFFWNTDHLKNNKGFPDLLFGKRCGLIRKIEKQVCGGLII